MNLNLSRRITRLQKSETKARERLSTAQNQRLVFAGIFFVSLFAAAIQPAWRVELVTVPLFVLIFPLLVIRTRRWARFSNRLAALRAFYERQNARCRGEAVTRDWETAFKGLSDEADRTVVSDLNLVGPHSLFTLLDETVSDGGRQALLSLLTRPHLNREQIQDRQRVVEVLAKKERWFFIRLFISAMESDLQISTQQTLEFLKKPFLDKSGARLVAFVLIAWLICVCGTIAAIVTGAFSSSIFVMAFIAIGLFSFNRIGPVFLRGVGLAHHLSGLVPLFKQLEGRLDNTDLREQIPAIAASRPSRQLRRFNLVLNFLSVESHPLIYLVINAIAPWAAAFTWLLERERVQLAKSFPECLEEFNRLEALICLVFLRVYQTNVFPTLKEDPQLAFQRLYHPLIPRDRVVANDFAFTSGKRLGLLTGSNMSGKSTFLRTVGVNQVLANMGAPVFAERFETSVFKIGSCIQVSDSLRDGFSYFYSEVLRLKTLIDDVHAGRAVLFLVDEIFRGTNNRERQIGSRAVIRSLIAPRSRGFVSTHDLELTALEERLPEVINLHFREDFEGGEMIFHYKLQIGPCPTTNALKIMERAGLELESV